MLDLIAQGSEPAGGAPTQDLVWGAAVAGALTLLALWVCFAHRTGRITWLGSVADFAARVAGLPRWAALPSAVTAGSLLIAAFGFSWDVASTSTTVAIPARSGPWPTTRSCSAWPASRWVGCSRS